MALSQRLEIRQGQSLVMTPLLQQSIKLLQYSNLELAAFVEAELEKNPLLERDGGTSGDADETQPENAIDSAAAPDSGVDRTLSDGFGAAGEFNAEDSSYTDDVPGDAHRDGASLAPVRGTGSVRDEYDDDAGARAAAEITLKSHLAGQAAIASLTPPRRFIADVLIDAVDDAGYLRADLSEIAARLDVSECECEAVLAVLQGFEPAGVFARSLSECLALQLKDQNRLDPAMQIMLTRLDLVARRDYAALSQLCGLDKSDIVEMIDEIRALDPKPGHAFASGHLEAIVPDILLRRGGAGWQIELNPDTLPRVLVNTVYYAEVSRTALSREARLFLSECFNTANWLTKSLDQRAKTVLKVAQEIVRRQEAFLSHGVRHLRPLNLKAVADAIGMHESTVSRVTSNKYIETPRGVFELKFFFTSAIQSVDGGEAHSAEAVKDRIRELVENERDDVLSDDRIVTILTADGIEIARRTVAKYRDALRIRSSVERRRLRRAESA
ncbi:MAG TPA: RNA polymerase factor sigma-54 [Micropepsaceae bacterium]|nr:RNA polymerase factor sigma-54 [Micropepsaceae bacterium]